MSLAGCKHVLQPVTIVIVIFVQGQGPLLSFYYHGIVASEYSLLILKIEL